MNRTLPAALAAAFLLAAAPALAQIEVSEPWSRATPPRAPNGAAYMTLDNRGTEPDRLVAAESPAAERVEIHAHLMEGGIARMREVEAIEVTPGSATVLQPGGLHVMLMGLRAPLAEGATLPLTLVFERAGRIEVEARVLGLGAGGPGAGHGGHGHGGHGHGGHGHGHGRMN